jgi:hypothetical protein
MPRRRFWGYDPTIEEIEQLRDQCIKFDVRDLVVQGDLPDTRGIKDLMRRDDQGRMNSCAGFGMTHAQEVCYFNQTGKWRQFSPNFAYTEGQKNSNIRGDNGATIHGVVKAAKEKGALPEDLDNDGQPEWPYTTRYFTQYPQEAYDAAALWKIGYSVELHGYDEILRFLQAGQGAVIVGGAWGNWRPTSSGIADSFRGGGGGHARCYFDWITRGNRVCVVEANSHGTRYGDNGFAYATKNFLDAQERDRWTVTIGVSDLDSPEPREIDIARKWLV